MLKVAIFMAANPQPPHANFVPIKRNNRASVTICRRQFSEIVMQSFRKPLSRRVPPVVVRVRRIRHTSQARRPNGLTRTEHLPDLSALILYGQG
jgi:hypothetical protein